MLEQLFMNSCDVVEFEIEVIKPCLEKSLSALVLKKTTTDNKTWISCRTVFQNDSNVSFTYFNITAHFLNIKTFSFDIIFKSNTWCTVTFGRLHVLYNKQFFHALPFEQNNDLQREGYECAIDKPQYQY